MPCAADAPPHAQLLLTKLIRVAKDKNEADTKDLITELERVGWQL